jgi:hypothetical protein
VAPATQPGATEVTTTEKSEGAVAVNPPAATDTPVAVDAKKASAPAARPAAAPVAQKASPTVALPDESLFSRSTYVIAAVVIVGGLGYLIWRRRQRSLLLEATAVSRSPFPTDAAPAGVAAAAAPGTRFTQELLNKLEWKRFEELVASYYNKTGVVASRTKTGPLSPVHIRISWKGEQRPFACVQCIPHPSGLIDPKPLQALCDVLAGEDVRRGYVVTSGKFGVPARDLAEEKHITLLSGDLFLEKLNALPEAARSELMRDATTGDYLTPSCPTCDTKMNRAGGDGWQCPQCGTTLPRA